MKPVPYERLPKTLGQHFKKRRMEQGLRQRDVQERFNLDDETYANWEKDRCYPAMKHWPQIIAFLGYDPNPEPQTIGQKLLAYRRKLGMSRKAMAKSLLVDEVTLWRWETDERKPQIDLHIKTIKELGLI